ncbi:hypothetical protein SDC9_180084 [bioreactor metagenome]|uniref:Uncharacterized protein n=1 Tax=bioreactor metagenome TaxID=1076179 RepID=A0A645H8K9_9ZZZZ
MKKRNILVVTNVMQLVVVIEHSRLQLVAWETDQILSIQLYTKAKKYGQTNSGFGQKKE